MVSWVIRDQLARSSRPGYADERDAMVARMDVDRWLEKVRSVGIKSIICLLAEDQLVLYSSLPSGLVAYYQQAGFSVAHIPAHDYQSPPLTARHLEQIWNAYQSLPKPVLVHCSAGRDRTGCAIKYITDRVDGVA